MTYAIETKQLGKTFREKRKLFRFTGPRKATDAVSDVCLEVREEEIFGLVGPNGAGKTTLIKMLTTLLVPTVGTARIAGFDVTTEAAKVRKYVGLVASNERSFYWPLTGRQNMLFFANLYNIPTREAKPWIDELMDLVGLTHAADQRFDGYSTGMRQRLALARGMLSKPRILFMDEPTKGVDPLGSWQIIELIRERIVRLWRSTLLITTHDLREIERLCDRVAIMDRGRILTVGTLAELKARASSQDVYQLYVARMSEDRIRAALAGALGSMEFRITAEEGVSKVELRFPSKAHGLAQAIRAIVLAGGDVVRCESALATFDDVFHTLLASRTPQNEVAA